jgi:hypothetical protein
MPTHNLVIIPYQHAYIELVYFKRKAFFLLKLNNVKFDQIYRKSINNFF